MKMCKVCNTREVQGKRLSRCPVCQRAFRAGHARKLRERKRKERYVANSQDASTGILVCSRCYRPRKLSEYGTSMPGRSGKLNSICDHCLTKLYVCASRLATDTLATPNFWRKKAYSCNTVERARIKRETLEVKQLSDLDWVCKPQDLANLYEQQSCKCAVCQVELGGDLHIDHMTPVSRGGAHTLSNLQLLCPGCNHLKHTMTVSEFNEFIVGFYDRLTPVVAELRNKKSAG
jgi:5-methylcytosine-specific restriction endonuclease McrA